MIKITYTPTIHINYAHHDLPWKTPTGKKSTNNRSITILWFKHIYALT